MNCYKNKLLTGLALASSLFATSAHATTYTVANDTVLNAQIILNNNTYDSLVVGTGVVSNTTDGPALEIDGVTNSLTIDIHDLNFTPNPDGEASLHTLGSTVGVVNIDGTIDSNINFDNSHIGTVNNSGTITGLPDPNAYGGIFIQEDSTVGTINNSGTITGSGTSPFPYGIWVTTSSSITGAINNSGTITGTNAGIFTDALSSIAEINNSALGVITGTAGSAITIGSGAIEINNLGTISGSGNAINLTVTSSEINNSGTITGTTAGIFTNGSGSIGTINNLASGVITGTAGNGITIGSGTVEINNAGTVFGSVHGIDLTVTSSEFTNSGLIVGNGGTAISYNNSSNNTLNLNKDSLIVGDVNFGNGSDNEVTLEKGSFTEGDINFGTGTNNVVTINEGSEVDGIMDFGSGAGDKVNIVGTLLNNSIYQYSSSNANDITLHTEPGVVAVKNGEFIAVVDQTPFAVIQNNTLRSSIDIGNLVENRLNVARLEDEQTHEVKLAMNYSPDYNRNYNQNQSYPVDDGVGYNPEYDEIGKDYYNKRMNQKAGNGGNYGYGANYGNMGIQDNNKAYFWSEAFGSYQKRTAYESEGDSKSTSGGLIIGFDGKVGSSKRLGGFLGAVKGTTDIKVGDDNINTTQIDSKGLFAGTYLGSNMRDSYFMDWALIAGVIQNDSDRLVHEIAGDEIATASYNNIFATPSVTVGKVFKPVTTSLTVRYTGEWVDGYQEAGTDNSNLTVDNRYVGTVSGRFKIENNSNPNSHLKIKGRVGVEANKILGSNNVDVTVIGQNVSFQPNARDYNVDGFVGLNTSYNTNNFSIYLDVEGSKGLSKSLSNNDVGVYGKLGFKYGF